MKKDRLEVLSDGVIVIIITLMVFEIKIPDLSYNSIIQLLQHIGVYAMSFLLLAVMWLNHHHLFKAVQQITPKIVWFNFLLLFFMSLIPLPTKILGQGFFDASGHMFYGAILTCNSIAFSLLQFQVNKLSTYLSENDKRSINRKNWFTVGLYCTSIPLSLLSIYISLCIFILVPAMYFLPSAKLRDINQ